MDKTIKYSNIITDLLREYERTSNGGKSTVKTIFIRDVEGHHYVLKNVGWQENRYIHGCLIHFDIIDGKVWVQENNTEIEIGEELVERGIVREDIVAGLIHPDARIDTAYANVI